MNIKDLFGIDIPRVIVRFEDMLFNPVQVVQKICDCVHGDYLGNFTQDFNYKSDKAKNSGGRDRKQAMDTYSDPLYRYNGYNYEDIIFLNDCLDYDLLEMFGYQIDIDMFVNASKS